MPRQPRPYHPGVPFHVVQRGNNRQRCFFEPRDYRYYLCCLRESAARYGVAVHAYVLMTNHVHLLMTPDSPPGISRVMQSIGRRYVQWINRRSLRTGTLWEGRHKSSLVDAEAYLLACYRYIESNPVRAGMVARAGDYLWSSFHRNALGEPDPLVSDHELYRRLGRDGRARRSAYRALFGDPLGARDLHAIRAAAYRSAPLRPRMPAASGAKRGSPGVR